jgi:putative ABC transport system permease protein
MTRHLLRLMWNRKRANGLIMLEIFCSFLILFAVAILCLHLANNYRQSIGFDSAEVWNISIDAKERSEPADLRMRQKAVFEQLLRTTRDLPQVESACGADMVPYEDSYWTSGLTIGGRDIRYSATRLMDDCQAVLRVGLAGGRWFSREDDGSPDLAVVINEQLARTLFGTADAVGQSIRYDDMDKPNRDGTPRERFRVAGVVPTFRQHGELSTADPYMIQRLALSDPKRFMPRHLLVRVRPDTPATFEETLVARLQAVAPDWSFEAMPVSTIRDRNFRNSLQPVMAFGIVAAFLLLMVALGLTGVLWQNVTQRTREIGLRRAKGATILNVRRQVLAELALLTTVALLLGVALVVQVPLLPLPQGVRVIPGYVFAAALAASVLAMYLLTIGCAWYPSRLATRIQPADALHYE